MDFRGGIQTPPPFAPYHTVQGFGHLPLSRGRRIKREWSASLIQGEESKKGKGSFLLSKERRW